MRGIQCNTRFLDEIDKFFDRSSRIGDHLFSLRNQVAISPTNPGQEVRFRGLHDWKFTELVGLSIALQYWKDDYVFIYIKEKIDQVKKRLPEQYQLVLEILLEGSPGEAFSYLIETSLWSTNTFFGNLVKQIQWKIINFMKTFLWRAPKVAQQERIRGYRDKGSRLKDDIRIRREEQSKEGVRWQREIDIRKKTYQDTVQLTLGLIT